MSQAPFLLLLSGVIGACLGSACVTASLRSSRGDTFLRGRSRCDGCGRQLSYFETIPILAYVRKRGACSSCNSPIDATHFAGEIAGAIIAVSAALTYHAIQAAVLTALGLLLLGAAVFDIKTFRLPDSLTALIAAFALFAAAVRGPSRVVEGLVSAAVALALLLTVSLAFERHRREIGLGLGDVKLTAGIALWCGSATSWVLVLASLAGLLSFRFRRPVGRRLPFGPYIAVSAWVIGMAQETFGSVTGLWTP